jgi:hypothetical protein
MSDFSEKADRLRTVEDEKRRASEADRREPQHPKGWEPGVEFNGQVGVLSTGPRTEPGAPSNGEWTDLLAIWDLDPEVYEIDPNFSPQFRAWDANLGRDSDGEACVQRFYYYKANVRLRSRYYGLDIEELLVGLGDHKRPESSLSVPDSPVGMVVPLSDWQIGKGDGDGVKGTLERLDEVKWRIVDRIADVKRMGWEIGCLYPIGIGDLVEQCWGNYPAQPFTVELNRREQVRLTRRVLRDYFIEWSKHVPQIVGGGVGGNHGENRGGSSSSGGKAKSFTTPGDNDDVAVFEMVAETLAQNDEAFGHIHWAIPDESLNLVLDIYGTIVGFNHGHLTKGGGDPQRKILSWWKDMGHQEHPIGDAHVLVTGHYHHLQIVDHGPKVWIQCPSLDGGSRWWQDMGGGRSASGQVSFLVGAQMPNGWGCPDVIQFDPPPPE